VRKRLQFSNIRGFAVDDIEHRGYWIARFRESFAKVTFSLELSFLG